MVSIPSFSGIRISVMMRSAGFSRKSLIPMSPSRASTTSYPSFSSICRSRSRTGASSSMIRMRVIPQTFSLEKDLARDVFCRGSGLDQGQIDVKRGSLAWIALNGDRATVAGHNPVDDGKPQPAARPEGLGGEKRLKDPLHRLLCHAMPGVTDCQSQVRFRLEVVMQMGKG